MKWISAVGLAFVAFTMVVSSAVAQRGVGQPAGVARQATLPQLVTLTGTVTQVEIAPCEATTGRAVLGTHFLMEAPDGETLNIHLGPGGIVDSVAKELKKGQEVEVEAFRTNAMKANQYVARTVECDGRMVTLRDETLRPFWAGRGWAADGQPLPGARPGRGAGRGWQQGGYGAGRGGYGVGRGRGQGWAQGRGSYGTLTGQKSGLGVWVSVSKEESESK